MIEAIVVFFSEVILSAPRAAMLAALAYPAALVVESYTPLR
jgi:hypothetical protein